MSPRFNRAESLRKDQKTRTGRPAAMPSYSFFSDKSGPLLEELPSGKLTAGFALGTHSSTWPMGKIYENMGK